MQIPSLLIVDDEKNTRDALAAALGDEFETFLARDAAEAFDMMETRAFDIVLTDLRMAGKSGLSVVERAVASPNRPVCVMMTAYGNVETAVEAMRRGAYDFLQKPVNLERLEHVLRQALRNRRAAANSPEAAATATGAASPVVPASLENGSESARAETGAPATPSASATPLSPETSPAQSAFSPPVVAKPRRSRRAAGGIETSAGAAAGARAAGGFDSSEVVGASAVLVRVIAQARQVAPSRATVLLLGETGTGKELFARMIHRNSPRAAKPFVPIHCGAIAPTLLEGELFGHAKGAFTGATEARRGFFESADGGTLFLDEIAEIALETQMKLLRVLQERRFTRLGSSEEVAVDVRLVCATNKDLRAEVAAGRFREDLFYRVNVVQLTLPPLRERAGDVPVLLDFYLRQFAAENGFAPVTLDKSALRALQEYAWPGNIRELRNLCENLAVMRPGARLGYEDIAERIAPPAVPVPPPADAFGGGGGVASGGVGPGVGTGAADGAVAAGRLSREANEKRLYREALAAAAGNRAHAARLLGVSRRTLYRKLDRWSELASV
ncbi:MAG: sigma-54 dependent transcriptional regulator [Puniceicoccales bacterium]|jgi:DNA-binding NtrC family response regulator|nr:sigma-54 dependent transcriptional regulator [Puniceicoccales bacterium]